MEHIYDLQNDLKTLLDMKVNWKLNDENQNEFEILCVRIQELKKTIEYKKLKFGIL